MAQIDEEGRIVASNLALRQLFGNDSPDNQASSDFVAKEDHDALNERLS